MKADRIFSVAGRVALVTGARVKIGYQASLKLLRDGKPARALERKPEPVLTGEPATPPVAAPTPENVSTVITH